MSKDLRELEQIFPTIDKEVIAAVYESNRNSLELTVNDLMELSNPTPAQPNNLSSQIESDALLALKLQERESQRLEAAEEERHRNTYRDSEISPVQGSNSKEISIRDSIMKGVDSVKTYFRRVSEQINSNAQSTPRTDYPFLPVNEEFGQFLNDNDQESPSAAFPAASTPGIDGSRFDTDEEYAKALQESYK